MNQIDELQDQVLNGIDDEIAVQEGIRTDADGRITALWQRAFAIFDSWKGKGQPAVFLTHNRKALKREVRESKETLDTATFQKRLQAYAHEHNWNKQQYSVLWNAITTEIRVIDQAALQAAVKRRPYLLKMVTDSLVKKPDVPARVRTDFSKQQEAFYRRWEAGEQIEFSEAANE